MIYQLFPILNHRSKQLSGTLSGSEQQMPAIARALMGRPELLNHPKAKEASLGGLKGEGNNNGKNSEIPSLIAVFSDFLA